MVHFELKKIIMGVRLVMQTRSEYMYSSMLMETYWRLMFTKKFEGILKVRFYLRIWKPSTSFAIFRLKSTIFIVLYKVYRKKFELGRTVLSCQVWF